MPPFDPLEVKVATIICKTRPVHRSFRGDPTMAEIHTAMPLARHLITIIRSDIKGTT